MPSTLVHMAFGGLIGAALLTSDFDPRAVAVVVAVTAFPDIDAFDKLDENTLRGAGGLRRPGLLLRVPAGR